MKLKKKLLPLLALLPAAVFAQFEPVQSADAYQVHADLTSYKEDQIKVEIVVPILGKDELIYQLPAMVPGTYKIYDFGRFVNELVATNNFGDTLEVEQLNDNQWKISKAKGLYKLSYWADDSYDMAGDDIFAPAGTSFQEDVFLLNSFGFVGYLDGYKDLPFTYEVKKPSTMVGTTALPKVSKTDTLDTYAAEDYFQLHDCPLLYGAPDTATVTAILVFNIVRLFLFSLRDKVSDNC